MTVSLNTAALSKFQNVDFGNDNAIVTKNNDDKLQSRKSFSSLNIFRWIRSSGTQAANNAVRTELLKSLGQAFGLKGMGTDNMGRTTFSREFMNKLSTLLGPEFRAADFSVNENTGLVTSGKPLTQRRIKAIMNATVQFQEVSYKDFTPQVYKNKLNQIKKELKLPENLSNAKLDGLPPYVKTFRNLEKCLDFLEKDADKFIRNTEQLEYDQMRGRETDPENKFEYLDPKTNKYAPMLSLATIRDDVLWFRLGGELLHLENVRFSVRNSKDIAPVKEYIIHHVKSYVKNVIDIYVLSKQAGKMDEYLNRLGKLGACLENKLENLENFTEKTLQTQDDVDAEQINIINNANKIDRHQIDLATRTSDEANLGEAIAGFIEKELEKPGMGDASWDDIKDNVKAKVVGSERTIVYITSSGFVPYLKDGEPIVRKVTEEDVEKIGQQIFDSL